MNKRRRRTSGDTGRRRRISKDMVHDTEVDGRYGKPIPHDPEFSGPLKYRSCTDVLCLIIFLVFIGCWVGVGTYAFKNGDPTAILIPRDTQNRRCGVDSTVIDKPFLFFFDLTKCIKPSAFFLGCDTPQVCVKECPQDYFNGLSDFDTKKLICIDNPSVKQPDGINCASWYLRSVPIERRCIPTLSNETKEWIKKELPNSLGNITEAIKTFQIFSDTEEFGQKVIDDLAASWPHIVLCVIASVIVALLYIALLRWTAPVMVWVSIFGVIVSLALAIYGSRCLYLNVLAEEPGTKPFHDTRRYLWLTILIISAVLLFIILFTTIFLRNRISLAIGLIEEGSKAVSSVTSVFLFPIFPWILQFLVIFFAIAVGVLLTTTGTPVFQVRTLNNNTLCPGQLKTPCTPHNYKPPTQCEHDLYCKMVKIDRHKYYNHLQWFNIFGFFWGTFFLSAFGQMVLASVFATWYWTRPRSRVPFFAVTTSTLRVLRYHIGTLAFGSLIITVCRMVRLVLEYIDRKLKKYDNELTKAILCLFKCFFWCLEKFLRFINRNAYIMCAIHGGNFCKSAKEAFMLLMRNILRVFVLDKVTDFLFFVSTILITIAAGALTYWVVKADNLPLKIVHLNFIEVPIIVVAICAYFISGRLFNVYGMAVDTLFLCFLEDSERNDGSPDKPYYMSKSLMKIFGKKNKNE